MKKRILINIILIICILAVIGTVYAATSDKTASVMYATNVR